GSPVLLQPGVGAGRAALDDLAVEVVGVGPQAAEEFLDADAGLAAEASASWYASRPCSPRPRSSSARTQAALMANSSAPMSTIRPRKPCLVSIFPCQRDMA